MSNVDRGQLVGRCQERVRALKESISARERRITFAYQDIERERSLVMSERMEVEELEMLASVASEGA